MVVRENKKKFDVMRVFFLDGMDDSTLRFHMPDSQFSTLKRNLRFASKCNSLIYSPCNWCIVSMSI